MPKDTLPDDRVGIFTDSGLVYAEGHPASDSLLLPPAELPAALQRLRENLLNLGVPLPEGRYHEGAVRVGTEDRPGFAGVRRLDSTADVEFDAQPEGLAALAGFGYLALQVPRSQAEVRYAKDGSGAVETVYIRGYNGRNVLGRAYDKGLEAFGPGKRGRKVRLEDQRRFHKGDRMGAAELTAPYVRHKFRQRFRKMYEATKGVTVAGHEVPQRQIVELGNLPELDGGITPRTAERLLGYVSARRYGLRQERTAVYRRKRELRELGLVEAELVGEDQVEVELHDILEAALAAPTWGAEG